MFGLVALAAVPCALLAWKIEAKRRERAAVVQINRLDGAVFYDWEFTEQKQPYGAAWLRTLLGDDYFSSVDSVITYSDAGIAACKRLVQLQSLHLSSPSVTDAGLAHLQNLERLEDLRLFKTSVTHAGLIHLERLTRLQSLNLGVTDVTDAGMIHLKGLTRLRSLTLYHSAPLQGNGSRNSSWSTWRAQVDDFPPAALSNPSGTRPAG